MDGLKLIRKQDIQDNDIAKVTDEVVKARTSVKQTYPTLKARLDAIDTNADNIQNNINQVVSGLQWKASVPTFNAIANTYPNPQEGWTVSTDDTNIVYRFDAVTNQWQPISSNSIGNAVPNGQAGLMTGADKAKLDGLDANQYVKKTGDTITGQLTVNGGITGSLNGNSTTATRLQTPRKINGTDFNGSVDITTEKWGKVRNIQIGNSIKQVDGSQNINFALNDIGASPTNHNHDNSYLKLSGGTLTGVLNANAGVVGNLTGNASTATRLQNARTIQLTGDIIGQANFDGTNNININTTIANPYRAKLTTLRNRVEIQANSATVNIGIQNYDVNNDVLNVYLSGVRLAPTREYTSTQSVVTLTGGEIFEVGDVVTFEVIKAVKS